MTKNELRALIRRRRERIADEDFQRLNHSLHRRLLSDADLRQARTVLVYWSFGREVETHELFRHLVSATRVDTIILPDSSGKDADPDKFRVWRRPATKSLPAVSPDDLPIEGPEILDSVDVALIPGLAYDLMGNRLGQGSGYFDKVLSRLPRQAVKLGLGFEFQIFSELPRDSWDVPVHRIASETRIIRVSHLHRPA
ncbi:MAG: 5-formyltetrahydrofolate cyclo-ligase [Candidatus Sumerlaeaceae bacterium]|nr:5-formyltetrahydrofolate cyclo-ligase [Candidatus Sumerlaeaceae bacterium]